MKHRFRYICNEASELLDGVNKLSTFMSRLNKISVEQEGNGKGWSADDYKGMAFEALVEVFIKSSPIDKRVNIANYRPHSAKLDGKDVGIDGYGESHNGNLHTVQIKYRSNPTLDLTTKDSISNFVATTAASPKYKDADMTIITTAKGLNQFLAENMYHDRINVLGIQELTKMLDDNSVFWDRFRKEMGV